MEGSVEQGSVSKTGTQGNAGQFQTPIVSLQQGSGENGVAANIPSQTKCPTQQGGGGGNRHGFIDNSAVLALYAPVENQLQLPRKGPGRPRNYPTGERVLPSHRVPRGQRADPASKPGAVVGPSNAVGLSSAPISATSPSPVGAAFFSPPIGVTFASPLVGATSAPLFLGSTFPYPPIGGTFVSPVGANSASLPVVTTSASVPFDATSTSPPVGATSASPFIGATFSSPTSGVISTGEATAQPGLLNTTQQMGTPGSAGTAFSLHAITVRPGEDIWFRIMSLHQHVPRGICVLSANGSVCGVTLLRGNISVTYEGRFEILSLNGSSVVSENNGLRIRYGGLNVLLAGQDGDVIGGVLTGVLVAASLVQVVVVCF